MKKIFLSFITLFLLAGAVFADDGGYYITHYDFYGSLSKDKVLTVQETIDVMFTDYRHGIYRELPYYYYVDRFDGKSVKDRNQTVADSKAQFGEKFIIFPNPMYGDWEGALYDYDFKKSDAEKDKIRRDNLKSFEVK